MTEFAYYPGCLTHTAAREYDESLRLVADKLDIILKEVPDWNCCGGNSASTLDEGLAHGLAVRNLLQAQALSTEVVVPCPICYENLSASKQELNHNSTLAEELSSALQKSIGDLPHTLSAVQIFTTESVLEKIQLYARKSLSGLKVVSYYGCLLARGALENPENPQSLDRLLLALGGEALNWPYKTECCGGRLAGGDDQIAKTVVGRIIDMARESGAEAIVTACPLCHANLDMRQFQLWRDQSAPLIPVFHFTQLIGLALGIDPSALGLNKHFVPTEHALISAGIRS